MSIAIATKGRFVPISNSRVFHSTANIVYDISSAFPPPADAETDTASYAYGGGIYPGALPLEEKKRLAVDVTYLRVNITEQEEPKLTISPIKVSDD